MDFKNDTSFIYQRIYERIKDNILEGKVKKGERLPSKRKLANEMQVSINSVANAYGQLLAEGYIYTVERSGYFVEEIEKLIHPQQVPNQKLPDDLKEKKVNRDGWLSLSHMTTDISNFPYKAWVKCQLEALDNHRRELSHLPHPQGPYIARESIRSLIKATRGVTCEPEQIVIGAGTKLLVQQLMSMQKGRKAALENPGYFRFYNLLRSMETEVHPIPLDDKGVVIEEVEAVHADFLFVTPSHQFPTGKIMPISRRIELLNWASSSPGRYIVEDDYDSEFKYRSDHIPSLQSLDQNNRVIYLGTFSKTMFPGLRISYMVLPPELLRTYHASYSDSIQTSNTLNLYTMHYFIRNGLYISYVKKMTQLYEKRRAVLLDMLQKRFEDNIEVEDIPAGLHFLAYFKTYKSEQEVLEAAKEAKLELYTMGRFRLNKQFPAIGRIGLIIGFANTAEEEMEATVARLHHVLTANRNASNF